MATIDTRADKLPTDSGAAEATVIGRPGSTAPLWHPLPDELVDEIFGIIFTDPGPIAIWRARIQQCCRRWYWYIEESPRYWTRVTEIPPPNLWTKHLAKSRNQNLNVFCTTPDTTGEAFILDLVTDVLDRVEQLHCSVDDNSDVPRTTVNFFTPPRSLEVISAVPAPCLRYLELHSNRYCPYIIESLFNGVVPDLRSVYFSHVSIPWRLLRQAQRLETVEIDCAPHLPSPFDILYIFKHCPNLVKFHIHTNDAASFVRIVEPVWHEPLQLPCGQVMTGSLQSFVATDLPVPGLHYILEHLSFPLSASINISIKQALTPPNPPPVASSVILSDVIRTTDDSHIELCITSSTIEVRDQGTKVRFGSGIIAGNFHEALLAIPSNIRNGVARMVVHYWHLDLHEARELFAIITSLYPSISEMDCWCETAWVDLLTDAGNRLPQLRKLALGFRCNDGNSVPEPTRMLHDPRVTGNLGHAGLGMIREICSCFPHVKVEGYELSFGGPE